MDKGFVYVARLIDYSGNFLGSFHKIGKSIQYKVRETQLNSTHLPVDILFVRVFETENQSMLEQILHTCFEDYRIQKQYVDRRNITTEWFDVDDTDVLNSRIDKVLKFIPNTTEINVISKISSDKETSVDEKEELVSALKRAKTKLTLKHNGEDLTQDVAADTFVFGLTKIANLIGWEKLDFDEDLVSKTVDEIAERYGLVRKDHPAIREVDGYKIWTGISNSYKSRILSKHILRNNIPDMEVLLETIG
jgi:hypothetical protein